MTVTDHIIAITFWSFSLSVAFGSSPHKETIAFSTNWDVGYGNSVFLVGSHPDVGNWHPTNGIKLRYTVGNIWTGQIAIQAGTTLAYKFISKSTEATQWCNQGNVVWQPGNDLLLQVPPQPTPPYSGKTIYYHSGWTSVFITVVTGTNATDYPLSAINTGRSSSEFLYQVSGLGETGEPIEFVMHNSNGQYDNAPYAGYGPAGTPNYHTTLDVFFLQDGHIFNYMPPADLSAPNIVTSFVASTVGSISGRVVRIYLPRGYTNNAWKRYPILYMHDGQNIFYNGGAAFGQWDVNVTANREISQGRMRECIIVGADNNSNRSGEYMPPGDIYPPDPQTAIGNLYLKYMTENVRPFIDQAYRTLNEPRNTLIAGSSLGGIISVYFGYETNLFGMIGAFSPGFARATNYAAYVANAPKKNIKIFIDNGTLEEDVNGANYWLYPRIAYDNFLKQGYVVGKDLIHIVGCDRGHVNRLWGEHFEAFAHFVLGIRDEPNLLAYQADPPVIQSLQRDTNRVSMTITALRGYAHSMERTSDLETGSWTIVDSMDPQTLPWGNIDLSDTNTSGENSYYRIGCQPIP